MIYDSICIVLHAHSSLPRHPWLAATLGGLVEGCHEGMGLVIFEAPKGRSQATHGDGFEGHLGDPGVLGDRTTGPRPVPWID